MFKDYFSSSASDYAKYRPDYPPAMFTYLSSLAPSLHLAWDCGTGNGQAARALAEHFTRVIATDASAEQIALAEPKANVEYKVMTAEKTDFDSNSIDFIMVAQALHWFDFEKFYAEVDRVLVPSGILAASCYQLTYTGEAEFDRIIEYFYNDITGPYWPLERQYIDDAYTTIPFPYKRLKTPTFIMEKRWDMNGLLKYLNTWSAVRNYETANHKNPLELIIPQLRRAWGDEHQVKTLYWPVHIVAGKKENP